MQAPPPEKKRKETLLSAELGKFLDKRVRVKFQGGREGENMQLASFAGGGKAFSGLRIKGREEVDHFHVYLL